MKHILFSLFSLIILSAFIYPDDSQPKLKTITENPAKDYTRTYSVLMDNPDTLYGKFTEIYKGVEITNGTYKNHAPQGKWIFRDINGKIERIMNFDNGYLNGFYVCFFKDGDTAAISFYKNGESDGISKSYYENGNPKTYSVFENGEISGKYQSWFENGKFDKIINYADGKMDGEYKSYSDTGILLEESNYKNGNVDGVLKEYYPTGNLRLSMEYKDGKEWNMISQFKKNGKPNKKTGVLVNGNGTINLYDDNGKITESKSFVNGLLEGIRKFYNSEGKLTSTDEYRNGLRNGENKFYYDGKISSFCHYSNDTLNGHAIYYRQGKPYEEGDYNNGKRIDGTWKMYTSEGFYLEKGEEKKKEKTNTGLFFPDGNFKARGGQTFLTFAETMPEFISGNFRDFLVNNITYPQHAKEHGISGRCYISFVINKLGFVQDVEIAKSSGSDELDNESLRIIKSMPRWEPGTMSGLPVRIEVTQPINFVLR